MLYFALVWPLLCQTQVAKNQAKKGYIAFCSTDWGQNGGIYSFREG